MTEHVSAARKTWAMRRVRDDVAEYWCGGRRWTVETDDVRIRRYVSPSDAVRAYDRHFRSYGYARPDATAFDVGARPGAVCACGKRPYASLREATEVLLRIWRGDRRNVRRAEERAYRCEVTPTNWHTTTLTREEYDELTGGADGA